MKRIVAFAMTGALVAGGAAQDRGDTSGAKPKPTEAQAKTTTAETALGPLDFAVQNIDGKRIELSEYRGKVVLMVNVASKCGLTPQYEQFQQLHERYAGKGLRILAFPANNFGGQEPGTNEQIKQFCKANYDVGFDLFAKVSVKGEDCCELYKFLTSPKKNGKLGGPIRWNFTKFLIGRDGKVAERFEPRTKPDAPEVVKALEAALEKKAP